LPRPLAFSLALCAAWTGVHSQDIGEVNITEDDVRKGVFQFLEAQEEYGLQFWESALPSPLWPSKLSFNSELTLQGRIWEFRYSTDSDSWSFHGTFTWDNTDIPNRFIPTDQQVPDFTFSWDIKGTIEYFTQRYDYVFYIYSSDSLSSGAASLDLRGWLWVSVYDFALTWEINAELDSLWESESIAWYFSWATSEPLYNPALILEWEYQRNTPKGNRYGIEVLARYEPWNAQASVMANYDYSLWKNSFLTFELWWTYRDYDRRLEQLDWFEDGWTPDASIWYGVDWGKFSFSSTYGLDEKFRFNWAIHF